MPIEYIRPDALIFWVSRYLQSGHWMIRVGENHLRLLLVGILDEQGAAEPFNIRR